MANDATQLHATAEELLDYFKGPCPEDRKAYLAAHLETCEVCRQKATRVRRFSAGWDGWTAEEQGEAYLRATLARALRRAEELTPTWRDRLAAWREQWAGGVEAAIRVVVEAPGTAARLITQELESLVRPGRILQFVPAPVRTRGVIPTRGGAERPFAPEGGVLSPAQTQAWVEATKGGISVHVRGLGLGKRPPLVVLVPTRVGFESLIREPEELSSGEYVAHFERVSAGEYVVVIEPFEQFAS
jgi:hypothetical protein